MTRDDISPAQLAHCIALAREYYDSHANFYQIDTDDRPFGALTFAEKAVWIDRALAVIEDVGPPRARVIATITPEMPWGHPFGRSSAAETRTPR